MIRIFIAESEAGTVFRVTGHSSVPAKLKPYTEEDPPRFGSLPCAAVSLLFQLGISCAEELQGNHSYNSVSKGDGYLYISSRSAACGLLTDFLKKGFYTLENTYPDDVRISKK